MWGLLAAPVTLLLRPLSSLLSLAWLPLVFMLSVELPRKLPFALSCVLPAVTAGSPATDPLLRVLVQLFLMRAAPALSPVRSFSSDD